MSRPIVLSGGFLDCSMGESRGKMIYIKGIRRVNFDNSDHIYIAIDLKSFYASVECMERGLDPLTANLVVADNSRTDKTICLAVSPNLKSYGIPGRPRLFEVKQKVKEYNATHPKEPLEFIVAEPRMAHYIEYSTRIFDIYLKYVAPEDIHTYSIDEVFMDVTGYLDLYKMSPHELTMKIIRHVLAETGITATAGIGTNMYLAKIAMDIEAKHSAPDQDGVRIAELDEMSYRRSLWDHKPITDFWRVGKGYARKLAANGMFTMGDVARCSIGSERDFHNEDLLYKLFGVNAELLIDHAWGWEPCTIKEIKSYKPETNSLSEGQVLQKPYSYEKARLIVKEMTDQLALNLVRKNLVCNQVTLTVGYDIDNLNDPERRERYKGEVTIDYYGREVPKHAHGTANLRSHTSSASLIMEAMLSIFDRVVNPELLVRRIYVVANNIIDATSASSTAEGEQLDLFGQIASLHEEQSKEEGNEALKAAVDANLTDMSQEELDEEAKIQQTLLEIKEKFGKNAVVKAMNLEEGATAMSRNKQIGGHKA